MDRASSSTGGKMTRSVCQPGVARGCRSQAGQGLWACVFPAQSGRRRLLGIPAALAGMPAAAARGGLVTARCSAACARHRVG